MRKQKKRLTIILGKKKAFMQMGGWERVERIHLELIKCSNVRCIHTARDTYSTKIFKFTLYIWAHSVLHVLHSVKGVYARR